jgi:hypothetical protein
MDRKQNAYDQKDEANEPHGAADTASDCSNVLNAAARLELNLAS